jgi:hypothetical protein
MLDYGARKRNPERIRMSIKGPHWQPEALPSALPEVRSRIPLPIKGGVMRKLLAFAGPGFLIAVGYMDPGNWATDLAAGSRYNYTLLYVIVLSNLMAILLQSLSIKLGVVSGRDLAQACRERFGARTAFVLWLLAEVAIAACDLAEVIGSAIALELLFHIPLVICCCCCWKIAVSAISRQSLSRSRRPLALASGWRFSSQSRSLAWR